MKSHLRLLLPPLLVLAVLPNASSLGATVPFTENFDSGTANWLDGAEFDLTYQPSGGPDGSSFASATFDFEDFSSEDFEDNDPTMVIVRGRTLVPPFGPPLIASDGAFFGNWLDDGVAEFRVSVRHDAPEPLSFFLRFAKPNNFPGVISLIGEPVQPGEWTELVVPIDLTVSNWVFEGPPSPVTLASVLSDVGRIQIAAFVPESLAGDPGVFTLDVDSIGIYPVPEPSAWISLSLLALALFATRRQWRGVVV